MNRIFTYLFMAMLLFAMTNINTVNASNVDSTSSIANDGLNELPLPAASMDASSWENPNEPCMIGTNPTTSSLTDMYYDDDKPVCTNHCVWSPKFKRLICYTICEGPIIIDTINGENSGGDFIGIERADSFYNWQRNTSDSFIGIGKADSFYDWQRNTSDSFIGIERADSFYNWP